MYSHRILITQIYQTFPTSSPYRPTTLSSIFLLVLTLKSLYYYLFPINILSKNSHQFFIEFLSNIFFLSSSGAYISNITSYHLRRISIKIIFSFIKTQFLNCYFDKLWNCSHSSTLFINTTVTVQAPWIPFPFFFVSVNTTISIWYFFSPFKTSICLVRSLLVFQVPMFMILFHLHCRLPEYSSNFSLGFLAI